MMKMETSEARREALSDFMRLTNEGVQLYNKLIESDRKLIEMYMRELEVTARENGQSGIAMIIYAIVVLVLTLYIWNVLGDVAALLTLPPAAMSAFVGTMCLLTSRSCRRQLNRLKTMRHSNGEIR